MFINEVCKECKLTKKAIEYYEGQGLIQPKILENGYRNFSINDIKKLKKISILRRLDFSILDIKEILSNKSQKMFYKVIEKKTLEIESLKLKQELAQSLLINQDWDYVDLQLETLEKNQSILKRLLNAFPGYYGKYISLHFALYLNDPIITNEQQEAFETIINFLDNINFDIPSDLQEYLDEVVKDFDNVFVIDISDNLNKVIQDTEKYILDNHEILKTYMIFKQSDEYKQSMAYKLQKFLEKFNMESGYNDIFIPAVKKLSKSYCNYHKGIEKANKVFLEKYSDIL